MILHCVAACPVWWCISVHDIITLRSCPVWCISVYTLHRCPVWCISVYCITLRSCPDWCISVYRITLRSCPVWCISVYYIDNNNNNKSGFKKPSCNQKPLKTLYNDGKKEENKSEKRFFLKFITVRSCLVWCTDFSIHTA